MVSNQQELVAPVVAKPPRSPFLDVLANRSFRSLWLGQVVSQLGDRFHAVAVMVLIYNLTGSATAVGALMMFQVAANWIFGLYAGVCVDRWDRRLTMIGSDWIRCGLAAALPLIYWLYPSAGVWPIYCLAFALSSVSTFFGPAKSASIPNLVQKDQLLHANSLSQMTMMFTMTIGMGLGGLAVKMFGTAPAFLFNAVSFIVSAAFISSLPPLKTSKGAAAERHLGAEIKEGLSYIQRRPSIMFIIGLLGTTILVSGAINVLFVPFVNEVLGLAPEDFSFFQVISSLGMFIGTAMITKLLSHWPKRMVLVGAVQTIGLSGFIGCLYPSMWMFLPIMFINGLGNAAINVPISVTLQEQVEDHVRGRVFSLVDVIFNSASIISMAPAGYLADRFGVLHVFMVTCAIIFGIGMAARFTKGYRQLV